MDKTEHKSFQAPGETREFPRDRAEIVNVGGGPAGWSSNPAGDGRMT